MSETIRCYNKEGNLETMAEINSDNSIKCFYNLSDRVFTRIIEQSYLEKGKKYSENNKSVIILEEDYELMEFYLDGEQICRLRKKGQTTLSDVKIKSRMNLVNDFIYENFTIKPELVNDWLKKL